MKADIWNLVDILMNHDPRQGQLIPESMMPFNLAGETLPPPPPQPITKTLQGWNIFGNPTTHQVTYKPLHPNQPNVWPRK
jgi:hypothetical protein